MSLVEKVETKLKQDSLGLAKEIGQVDQTYDELMSRQNIDRKKTLGVLRLIATTSTDNELKSMAKVVLHEIAKQPSKEEFLKKANVMDNLNANND